MTSTLSHHCPGEEVCGDAVLFDIDVYVVDLAILMSLTTMEFVYLDAPC